MNTVWLPRFAGVVGMVVCCGWWGWQRCERKGEMWYRFGDRSISRKIRTQGCEQLIHIVPMENSCDVLSVTETWETTSVTLVQM